MTSYPFEEKELRDLGFYDVVPGIYGMPGRQSRKYDTPITPKENLMRMYRGEKPLWMPNLGTDCNLVQPEIMPDAFARNHGGIDWFGIDWEFEPLTNAAMVRPGTRRLSDITKWKEELIWPDLNAIDWAKDYKDNYESVISSARATNFVIVNGLFERTADLTSFVDLFCYLLEEPEALSEFYDKLVEFHIDLMKIAKKYYHADIITFHDDMGSQKGSFMSPETFREIMLPQYIKINNAAHEMGLFVNYHSCGSVANQIPNFIEAGFDSWEGQDSCNNKLEIMETYGDKLIHTTMVPIPETAEDDEVDKIIDNLLNTIGKTGRFIAWPVDMRFGRAPQTAARIYEKSRRFYCG